METELGDLNFEVYDNGDGFITNGDFWQRLYKPDIVKLKTMLNKKILFMAF